MISRRAVVPAIMLLAAIPVHAGPVLGRDYVMFTLPQPTGDPGKIEVIEFFSYGCPFCNGFHPFIDKWSEALPGDVVFTRVPVTFDRPAWQSLGRCYYTLKTLGLLPRLDAAVFDAVHVQGVPLADGPSVAAWAAKQGLDAKLFLDTFNSAGVETQLDRAQILAHTYRVDSLATLVVAGKYKVKGDTFEQLIQNLDAVIGMARAEMK
jgi:protein dithiol oxidoreductase (disulfide-forming)